MINLEMGINEVCLTLTENVYGDYRTERFLFKFFSHSTNQSIYFLSTDLNYEQLDTQRFNKFNIEVVDNIQSQDLNAGVIYLPNTGFLEYTAYAQLEPELIPQPTDLIVEQGRVLYGFSDATITSFSPDIETIIYNG